MKTWDRIARYGGDLQVGQLLISLGRYPKRWKLGVEVCVFIERPHQSFLDIKIGSLTLSFQHRDHLWGKVNPFNK